MQQISNNVSVVKIILNESGLLSTNMAIKKAELWYVYESSEENIRDRVSKYSKKFYS